MKNLSRVFTGVMLMAFLLFCHTAGVNAAVITKTLDRDTRLVPPGVMATRWGDIPEFKSGTVVKLNENGEVIDGILASYAELPCVDGLPFYTYSGNDGLSMSPRIITFKLGTEITFNDKGEVTRGTIGQEYLFIPISKANYIEVRNGTKISFHENGIIATCTPNYDIYLRPVGWTKMLNTTQIAPPALVEFGSGIPIELNDKGEVVKGTLNKDTKLLSPDGTIKVYQAGTTVEFDDNGVVIKTSNS